MNNRSVLSFEKYIVKKIEYNTNESYTKENRIELDFDFDVNCTYAKNSNSLQIELSADIFKGAEEKNYPFEMSVCLKGFFSVEEEFDISLFEKNATAILFPYLRAIVSTYTANANVAPVILPPMNINAYLDKKKSES